MIRHLSQPILWTAVLAAALAAPARAEEERKLSLEAFFLADAVIVEGIDGLDADTVYGLRPTYRLSRRWAVESALGYYDGSGRSDFEIVYLDLSARFSFKTGRRVDFFAFGGPSLEHTSFNSFSTGENVSRDETELHVGLGFEIGLSKRLYLRPDFIARTQDLEFDGVPLDISLGLGFRL